MVLPFPADQEFGRIYLAGPPPSGVIVYLPTRRFLTRAKGTVRFKQRMPLIFAPNDSVSDRPEIFKALPPDSFIYLDCERLSLDDGDIDSILHLTALRFLNLEGTEITDLTLGKLKALPDLIALDCFATNIKGAGLKNLIVLKNLRRLRIGCNKLDLACVPDLAKLSSLELLNLDRVNLSDADLLKLAPLKKLRALEIPNNKKITAAAIPILKKMTTLRTVDIRSCSLTPKDLAGFANSQLNTLGLMPENYSTKEIEFLRNAFRGKNCKLNWISREESVSPELFRPLK